MIRNLTLTVCTFCLIITSGRAQDVHFTLYDMVPLVFNPGETGAFSGTFRVAGIYRDQWMPVSGFPNEYKTPSISVDVPVIKGFRDQDWVGVGLMMLTDNSGSLDLKLSQFKLSAAYHLGLDKKGNTVLSLGYQTGSVQQRIDVSGFDSDPQNNNPDLLEPDMNFTSQGELKSSYTDHVGGLHLRSRFRNGNVFKLGVSVGHIGSPNVRLGGGSGGGTGGGSGGPNDLPLQIFSSGSYRAILSEDLAFEPGFMVQFLGKDREIVGRAMVEYLLNPEKEVVLRGGLGYRFGDAVQVMAGVKIKKLTVMAGYDVNVSKLSGATSSVGGFELSASLIGIIYKRPDPDPVLFCPRF